MDIYAILSTKEHVERQLKIYVKYINRCAVLNENLPTDTYTELHHICPKSMFPDYANLKDHKWNGINLTLGQHFTAHLILFNAYPNAVSMSRAFFFMCNQNIQKNQAIVTKFKELKTYYEDARSRAIDALSGMVTARNIETNKFESISCEAFHENRDRYEATTTGMVTARNIETNKFECISRDAFHENRDRYEGTNTGMLYVIDKENMNGVRIPVMDYYANPERYESINAGVVSVRDKSTGEIVRLSTTTYHENTDKYESFTNGFVTVVDIATSKTIRVTVDEFNKNKNSYKANSVGKVSVIDLVTGETKQIDNSEFHENKHLYKSVATGMVAVIKIETGEKLWIPCEDYTNNPHIYKCNTSGYRSVRSIHKVGPYKKPIGYNYLPHEISANGRSYVHNPVTNEDKILKIDEVVGPEWRVGRLPSFRYVYPPRKKK